MLGYSNDRWTFTDVYCVDVSNTTRPISTMYPLLTGVHVSDENICIPPDIFIGKHNTTVQGNESKQEANEQFKKSICLENCNQFLVFIQY